MKYFESHAHYYDQQFKDDLNDLLQNRLQEANVNCVVNASSDMEASHQSVLLAEKYPFLFASVGIHPHSANLMQKEDLNTLEHLSKHKKVVAIGEIGLDFHYEHSPHDVQVACFCQQLELAQKVGLPVIIHSREAALPTYDILKNSSIGKQQGGVIHCYSGHAQMALDYVDMGYYIGIGGIVTFPNAKKLVEVVEQVPLCRLLLETDCPYLAPVPNRGKRNDSSNLSYIAETIAKIKGISVEEVTHTTWENGMTLFQKIKP